MPKASKTSIRQQSRSRPGPNSLRSTRAQERNNKKLIAELGELRQENKSLRNLNDRSRAMIQDLESKVTTIQHQNEEFQVELDLTFCRSTEMKDILHQVEGCYEQTSRLLKETVSELEAAHRFMSLEDALSGAEVIGMVNSLNDEIFQLAANVAETWSPEFSHPGSLEWQQLIIEGIDVEAVQDAQRSIGTGLQEYLTRGLVPGPKPPLINPMPVQIALQVCLVCCCTNIMLGWTFKKQVDYFLQELYINIAKAESRAAVGRWRSMTRAQIRKWRSRDGILSNVDEIVLNVLIASGYRCSDDGSKTTARQRLRDGGLSGIVDMALRLNDAIGGEIVSMEIIPLVVPEGVMFDPATMNDFYGVYPDGKKMPGTAGDGNVIGTVGVGLKRLSNRGEDPRKGILLKPKVILNTTMQELLA